MSADEEMRDMKSQVLSWVNDVRADFGFGPLDTLPKGSVNNRYDCVIARCFQQIGRARVSAGNTLIQTGNGYTSLSHPHVIFQFIHAFDRGAFRELRDDANVEKISAEAMLSMEKAAFHHVFVPLPKVSMLPAPISELFKSQCKALMLSPAGCGS